MKETYSQGQFTHQEEILLEFKILPLGSHKPLGGDINYSTSKKAKEEEDEEGKAFLGPS